jgi:hypothetical protein
MSFAPTDMRFNAFQWGVIHALSWVVCLADGWVIHNHVLFGVGLFFMVYSMWRMIVTATPEDEEFERIAREQEQRGVGGWRKRQIVSLQTNVESFDDWEHSHRPAEYFLERKAYLAGFEAGSRNERLKKELND